MEILIHKPITTFGVVDVLIILGFFVVFCVGWALARKVDPTGDRGMGVLIITGSVALSLYALLASASIGGGFAGNRLEDTLTTAFAQEYGVRNLELKDGSDWDLLYCSSLSKEGTGAMARWADDEGMYVEGFLIMDQKAKDEDTVTCAYTLVTKL